MQVIIKPIPEQSKWHGKTGKDSFARPHGLEVLLDSATGKYATGLTEEETIEYQIKTGLDLSNTYKHGEPHPYWSTTSAKIKLPSHSLILNTEKDTDFIKIKNLKASKFVANSFKEWEDGLYPEATHIIYDEVEDVEMKATKVQRKNKAILWLAKQSLDYKTNIVRLLSEKSVAGRSQDFIDVEVDALLNNNETLEEIITLISMDKAEFTVRATIQEGINRRVLTMEGNAIFYMGEKLGFDMDDTVKYFLDPNNQQLKVVVMQKIQA